MQKRVGVAGIGVAVAVGLLMTLEGFSPKAYRDTGVVKGQAALFNVAFVFVGVISNFIRLLYAQE